MPPLVAPPHSRKRGVVMAKKKQEMIKLDVGSIYKKGDTYYYRYQINGTRKAISLQTINEQEAIKRAKEFTPVTKAKSIEVISAHIKHARNLEKRQDSLYLVDAWEKYAVHPDRAIPATISEQGGYKSSFEEFMRFVFRKTKNHHLKIDEITPYLADAYAQYLRTTQIGVSTHERKIKRIRKVFEVLHEYYPHENPFRSKSLFRKTREEQQHVLRRQAFTREQEEALLQALDNPQHVVKNKHEIKMIYIIAMNTGQRLKDCVLLRWDAIDMKNRLLSVKQFKTGKEVVIPVSQSLYDALNEAKKWQINQYVCPKTAERYNRVDEKGKNTGAGMVNVDVLRPIKWIGLETSAKVEGRKMKMTLYGFHSFRHSFVSFCAEANIPKAVVTSIVGANSDIVDKHYTHVGEEAQRRAIEAITGTQATSFSTQLKKIIDQSDSLSKDELVAELKKLV